MMSTSTIIYALLGGILPAVVWLIFWLYEDWKRPEPKGLIARVFVLGMLAVLLVIPFQKFIDDAVSTDWIIAFSLWAFLEEGFKFMAAAVAGLSSKEDDEPLDPMIYMITAALGFAALENTFFITKSLVYEGLAGGIITGNLRFIGSGLLHTISSGAIGIALALSFYKPRRIRILWGLGGFAVAVAIHAAFNLFLVSEKELNSLMAFTGVWVGIAILLLFFEKVKTIKNKPPEIPNDNGSISPIEGSDVIYLRE